MKKLVRIIKYKANSVAQLMQVGKRFLFGTQIITALVF